MARPFQTDEQQIQLPPLLEEFRLALEDEIEVAKRNSSNSAIPLSNGQRISQQGSSYQYAFSVDSVLNTPDGAPGDLVIPGKAPLGVSIIHVEGLRIVISVEADLGMFVPTARLQTNLTILMRKLIERIETHAASENPAAQRMLGEIPVSGNPQAPQIPPSIELSQDQRTALESALGRDLTVIWGPPGTGKTRTIGTITQSLNQTNRTVLIVSHTNAAVDQAIKHVALAMRKTEPERLEQGEVIRIGKVSDNKLIDDCPDVLVETQVARLSKGLSPKIDWQLYCHNFMQRLNAMFRCL